MSLNIDSIIPINTTFIGSYYLKDYGDINLTIDRLITELIMKEKTEQKSNVGGWQSDRDFLTTNLNLNLQKKLESFLLESVGSYLSPYRTSGGQVGEIFITSSWANYCPKYSYHTRHTHPGVDVSGVYYVKIPKGFAHIKFQNPHQRNSNLQIGLPHFYMQPKEGQCLIFDSGLEHEVEQNLSDEPRISISFNCVVRGW